MAFAKGVIEFKDEILFKVGERVHVDLKIPKKDVRSDTGIIQSCDVRFLHTPNLRKIRYTIRLDEAYTKPSTNQMFGAIGEIINVEQQYLSSLRTSGKERK